MNPKISGHLAAFCRQSARISGLLLFLLVIPLANPGRMAKLFTWPLSWDVAIVAALAFMVLGGVLGWVWELAAGIVSVGGCCLGTLPLHHTEDGLAAFYFLMALPGALYLLSALLRRQQQHVSV
jgi:hypothetical protein